MYLSRAINPRGSQFKNSSYSLAALTRGASAFLLGSGGLERSAAVRGGGIWLAGCGDTHNKALPRPRARGCFLVSYMTLAKDSRASG